MFKCFISYGLKVTESKFVPDVCDLCAVVTVM